MIDMAADYLITLTREQHTRNVRVSHVHAMHWLVMCLCNLLVVKPTVMTSNSDVIANITNPSCIGVYKLWKHASHKFHLPSVCS